MGNRPPESDLVSEAIDALDQYCDAARNTPEVWADHEKARGLHDIRESIVAHVTAAEGYPNPAYNGLVEATARCLLLWLEDTDAYEHLVGDIARDPDQRHLDTYPGLVFFSNLINSLSDDHSWVMTDDGRLKLEDSDPLPLVTPRRFLGVIVKLTGDLPAVDESLDAPKPL